MARHAMFDYDQPVGAVRMHPRFFRFAAGFAAAAMAIGALAPMPDWFGVVDKAMHVAAFALMAYVLRASGVALFTSAASLVFLAFSVEIVQGFAGMGRSASGWDLLGSLLGAGLGLSFARKTSGALTVIAAAAAFQIGFDLISPYAPNAQEMPAAIMDALRALRPVRLF
ncbi:MAG: hypothetical protein AB7M12_13015 [Hyphomonadaceae bacterium]